MRKPNIVFVLTDDQGYGDLGCHGNPILKTPALDAFHGEALRFTDFHVGPTCAPTRAGLMTGHYANSTGVWHTIGGRSLLRKNEWTLPQALRENGYRTGIFGKWHLGDATPYRPQDRGFERVVVHGGGGISQTPDHWGNDYFDDTYSVDGVPTPFTGYCTEVFFAEAKAWIAEHRDEPFFCYLAPNAPHAPYNVPRQWSEPYRGKVPESRARFYGMIANLDAQFAHLREHLRRLDLERDTILIFMTDNGTSGGCDLDREGFVVGGWNAGLRGIKNSPYEGGHRVPFFLRYPAGGIGESRDIADLTANVDVMPTLLELCGVDAGAHAFHGRSLAPLLAGGSLPPRAVVTDSQRLVQPVKWRQSAVMEGPWRLIDGKELYEVDSDREQRRDLAAGDPARVARLRAEYEKWWELVSTQVDETIPLSLGGPGETCLTSHDWRGDVGECAWSQADVRAGKRCNSYLEVLVERAGRYRFELRRWPREAGHALARGITGSDVPWRRGEVDPKYYAYYEGGAALPLLHARLSIAGQEVEAPLDPDSASVSFTLNLPLGETRLQTWLLGVAGLSLGAYYVYVNIEE